MTEEILYESYLELGRIQKTMHAVYHADVACYEPADLLPGSWFMTAVVPEGWATNKKLVAKFAEQVKASEDAAKASEDAARESLSRRREALAERARARKYAKTLSQWAKEGNIQSFIEWMRVRRPSRDVMNSAASAAYLRQGLPPDVTKSRMKSLRYLLRKNIYRRREWDLVVEGLGCSDEDGRRQLARDLSVQDGYPLLRVAKRRRPVERMGLALLPAEVRAALDCVAWRAVIEQRFRQQELTYLLTAYEGFRRLRRGEQDESDPYWGYGLLSMKASLWRGDLDWYLQHRDRKPAYCIVPTPPWIKNCQWYRWRNYARQWPRWRKYMDHWYIRKYITTRSEYDRTESLRNEFVESGYRAGPSLPTILISEELPHLPDDIDIDHCGIYKPKEKTIVLYDRILWRASLALGASIEDCRKIVLVHEVAHWVTHSLAHWRVRSWPTKSFCDSDDEVIEGLAELLTYWTVRSEQPLLNLFLRWNAVAPAAYQTWQRFRNCSHKAVIMAVLRMRELERPSTMNDMVALLP